MSRLRLASVRARLLALAAGALCALPCAAQIVNDPTRPLVGSDGAAVQEGGVALQSIVISPTMRAAIINGQVVKVGEKYGNARLVRLSETEAVLRDGAEVQVLRLHPAVEKKDAKPAAKTAARPAR